METVYKYELKLTDRQIIFLPADSQILDVQEQNGALCAWVRLETNNPYRNREILIAGTGNTIPSHTGRHISTVQMDSLVYHVFEV